MTKRSVLRIAPGAEGVSIWSAEIFGAPDGKHVRDFLTRAFAVKEVERVELRRSDAFGRISYGAVDQPAKVWKKLSRALSVASSGDDTEQLISEVMAKPISRADAGALYLGGPSALPVRVSRIGNTLSTWRVRSQSEQTLQLWHPILRNRRDLVFRLEEELSAIFGVEDFRASALTTAVSIRFDHRTLTPERLAKQLEQAWPRVLEGSGAPPSRKRFVAAGGLLGLAYTGQYLVPALRPIAVASLALYSLPNVIDGTKKLTRGQIGLTTLYATGVGFMLISGMPFASATIAVLMQLWPQLAHQKLVRSQRRLFGGQRRRPAWAQLARGAGSSVEISVDDLRKGDRIVVGTGEIVPVDGVVDEGFAIISGSAPFNPSQRVPAALGDTIAAGALVQKGSLTIRVVRTGAQTDASYIDTLLPHASITGLPAAQEVERIANRNAKPALALSLASLLFTRQLRPSQAIIRPDYATAPRLSAQLSALQGVAHGLQHGVLFRNVAALDRIGTAEVFVFDESAGLDRKHSAVAGVRAVNGATEEWVAGYAWAAEQRARSERGRALASFIQQRKTVRPKAEAVRHELGITRYRDRHGHQIEVTSAQYLAASKIAVPAPLQAAARAGSAKDSPALQPLWVLKDGVVLGVVTFERTGAPVGKRLVAALKAQNKQARFVYITHAAQAQADALASKLGIEAAHGGLRQEAKADLIRGLGRRVVWIGDGTDPQARESIAASLVSVSVSRLSAARREDAADVLLPHEGAAGLPRVIQLARAHTARLADDYRVIYVTNLLGIAGAFLARFGSLQAGLLSNAGTGLIYARHARALDRLAAGVEKRHARLAAG